MNIPDILGAVGGQFTEGYPVLRNDPGMAALVMAAASEVLGAENVIPLVKPSMGVDDFAYFLQRIPGCYFMLGTGRWFRRSTPAQPALFPTNGVLRQVRTYWSGHRPVRSRREITRSNRRADPWGSPR